VTLLVTIGCNQLLFHKKQKYQSIADYILIYTIILSCNALSKIENLHKINVGISICGRVFWSVEKKYFENKKTKKMQRDRLNEKNWC
jgi:hypothetical protein